MGNFTDWMESQDLINETCNKRILALETKTAISADDTVHIQFIYDRLQGYHDENPQVDYMRKLGNIIVRLS